MGDVPRGVAKTRLCLLLVPDGNAPILPRGHETAIQMRNSGDRAIVEPSDMQRARFVKRPQDRTGIKPAR